GAVAVVFVEPVGGSFRRAIEARSAQYENVQPAVVIVIQVGATAAHSFDDVILPGDAAVDGRSTDSGCLGNVGKLCMKRQAGRFATRRRFHHTGGHALSGEANTS